MKCERLGFTTKTAYVFDCWQPRPDIADRLATEGDGVHMLFSSAGDKRLPKGQYLTKKWPVLHAGSVPKVTLDSFTFRVFGLVDNPVTLSYQGLMDLPQEDYFCDIHCVTTWSRYDNTFTGIPFREVMNLVNVAPEAKYVLIHAEQGYTTNVPLEDLLMPGVMFAHSHDGVPLTPEHGWPLRLVVPHLYFWKSAKWVKGIEFLADDRAGFWENYGYHLYGDPFLEQRYRDDPEWLGTGKNSAEYYRTIRARVHRELRAQNDDTTS